MSLVGLLLLTVSCGGSEADDHTINDTVVPTTPVTISIDDLDDISLPAVSDIEAVRVDPPDTTTSTTEVCASMGLFCLPYAPEGLDWCAEMEFYRVQFGLPEAFNDSGRHQRWVKSDGIGWRESKCHNEAISPNGCCGGYWQLYISTFIAHGHSESLGLCGVDALGDVVGHDPIDKQRQACVTVWLYGVSGLAPWA